jgi:PAS domain-containing protein
LTPVPVRCHGPVHHEGSTTVPGRTAPDSTPPAQGGGTLGEESAPAAIVRSSSDAVIAKTVDGFVTAWNDGAHLLHGYPAKAIVGRSLELTIRPPSTRRNGLGTQGSRRGSL